MLISYRAETQPCKKGDVVMSQEYAMSRVRDALDKSDGNHLKAQRLLMQWLEKDQSLLLGLVAPHMQGIVSHAVNHVAQPAKKEEPKRLDITEPPGEFGAALMSTLKGGRSEGFGFGQSTPQNISKPGQASKAHIDAITKIAGGNKGDGDKGK